MDLNNCLKQAHNLAAKAKPGFVRINGKLYTFEFDQKEWVYQVYEDGFALVRFNTKSLNKAKKMLADWIAN